MPSRDIANRMVFVQALQHELHAKLAGHDADRIWDIFGTNPEERYFVGQLYPRQNTSARYATIHQISVDFIVPEADITLSITPQGSFCYRVFPTLTEQLIFTKHLMGDEIPLLPVYEKVKLEHEITLQIPLASILETGKANISLDDELDRCIAEAYARPDIYRILRAPLQQQHLESEDAFRSFLEAQTDTIPMKPVWSLQICITAQRLIDGLVKVSVTLLNDTNISEIDISADKSRRTSRHMKSYSNRLFDGNLRIEVGSAAAQSAVGHNCSIDDATQGNVVQTTHMPCYVQKRLKNRADLETGFAALLDEPIKTLRCIENVLRSEAHNYAELERFANGIAMLERYPLALEAFVLMNRAFQNSAKGYSAWRLFQLVFVVSLIPDMLVQEYGSAIEQHHIDRADVLYFPTGGGKTEAFFAAVVFNLFFDRLRGKSAGVSAIIKYPLRLLSAQQVSRACEILASAECIRRQDVRMKDSASFAVGYFAGEANTPNALNAALMNQIDAATQDERNMKYRLLDCCSFCGKEVDVQLNRAQITLNHVCPICGILPLHIVDKEIYRYLPSVIISTLDKMAAIGYQSNFRNIMGRVTARCPRHGYTSKLKCTEEACEVDHAFFEPVHLHDAAPGLVICDELHLNREALGTFSAHYESAFQHMIGKPIKYIGATATISGYAEQMYHLFGKGSILFPVDKNNPYSYIDETEDNRLILSYIAYDRAMLHSLVYAMRYMREILCKYRNSPLLLRTLPGMDVQTDEEALAIVADYWLLLEYNNRKLDCNLVTGAFDDPINIELQMLNMPGFDARKITGDDTFGTVKSLIQDIESADDMFGLFNAIVSTSMISHGVDSRRLNNMFFFGAPSTTAEYIQAFSRTGRIVPSFVLVVARPKNEKDISQLKHFYDFHKHRDQMIDAVPIDRWAERAITKTFPGVLSAFFINHYDLELQRRFGNLYHMDMLQAAIREGAIDHDELQRSLLDTYQCADPKTSYEIHFSNYITEQLSLFWERMTTEECGRDYITSGLAKLGWPVMTSLRDTDESLKIVLDTPFGSDNEMHRGVIQSLRNYLPNAYVDFHVRSTRITYAARVGSWRTNPLPQINEKQILTVLRERLVGFEESGGKCIGFPQELTAKNTRFVTPLLNDEDAVIAQVEPLAFFCNDCKRAYSFPSVAAYEAKDGISRSCCRHHLRQIMFVYPCECGYCGSLRVLRCAKHPVSDMFYDTRGYAFTCAECQQRIEMKHNCPDCGRWLMPHAALDRSNLIAASVTLIDLLDTELQQSNELILAKWLGNLSPDVARRILSGEDDKAYEAYQAKLQQKLGEYTAMGFPEEMAVTFAKADLRSSRTKSERLKIQRYLEKALHFNSDTRLNKVSKQVSEFNRILSSRTMSLQDVAVLAEQIGIANPIDRQIFKQMHISKCLFSGNIPLLIASYGYTRRSDDPSESRDAQYPLVLRSFRSGDGVEMLSKKMQTEGILFEIDRRAILRWLIANGIVSDFAAPDMNDDNELRLWFLNNVNAGALNRFDSIDQEANPITHYVYRLLHSFAHALLRKAGIAGLETSSLGEYLLPNIPAFLIYCNNVGGVSIGAMSSLYKTHLTQWLRTAFEDIGSCIADPVCITRDKACNGCLLLPSTSCEHQNRDLDRSLLCGFEGIQGFWQ